MIKSKAIFTKSLVSDLVVVRYNGKNKYQFLSKHEKVRLVKSGSLYGIAVSDKESSCRHSLFWLN